MSNTQENNNKKKRNNRSNYRRGNQSSAKKKNYSSKPKNASHNKNVKKPSERKVKLDPFNRKLKDYLEARAKFYSNFRGQFSKKVEKSYRHYTQQLKNFWLFTKDIAPEKNPELAFEVDFFKKDTDYSRNNPKDLRVEPSTDTIDHIHEYHENVNQKGRESFKDDDQESTGDMEDYEKYKASL